MTKKIILFLSFFILVSNVHGLLLDVQRHQRRVAAHTIKSGVAQFDETQQVTTQLTNADEQRYFDLRGSFGKALKHTDSGYINRAAFDSMVFALQNHTQAAFDTIIMGGSRRLVNPQGSLEFSLAGNDGWIHAIPPAPAFDSPTAAGEMVELYWTALVRDVPFNAFTSNSTVASAVADLNTLSNFQGPKVNGRVTPETFLRGSWQGELVGPYISQFLYQTIPYGSTTISPLQTVPVPGVANDFMTDFTDWFTIANGGSTGSITFDGTQHFIRTPRDLTQYVHVDFPGQVALNAALYLMSLGNDALDSSLFYTKNPTQEGFVTFGIDSLVSLIFSAVNEALKAAWYQKWQVNRRLRPEEFGFYLDQQLQGGVALGINNELVNSSGASTIFSTFGNYFLPQAYPEGSPTHPSYPAGHATVMGAAVTILKAFFNEDFVIPSPLEPNPANDALVPLMETLTVGGELNKLASNIALGRDHAGVHYRSDGTYGMLLGEQIAIDVLNNASFLFNENFSGYSLTTFSGVKIKVGAQTTV